MMNSVLTSKKALHESIIEKLTKGSFPDGTYNIDTMESVSFEKGYQVSFYTENMNLSEFDYEFIASMFEESSMDGKTYIGFFDGCAEISYRIKDKSETVKLAKMFNQICIWSWKDCDCIATGGTGK